MILAALIALGLLGLAVFVGGVFGLMWMAEALDKCKEDR